MILSSKIWGADILCSTLKSGKTFSKVWVQVSDYDNKAVKCKICIHRYTDACKRGITSNLFRHIQIQILSIANF